MNSSEILQTIFSFIGIAVSIVAIVLSVRMTKKQIEMQKNQDDKENRRYNLEIEQQARKFIQKYNDDNNELRLISLAIIANNYDVSFPYRRQFYKDWCLLNIDVKNKVCSILNIDTPINLNLNNVFRDSCKKLKAILGEDFYQSIFYEEAKYLEHSLEYHKNNLIPNETVNYSKNLFKNEYSIPIKYKDVIKDILAKSDTIYETRDEKIDMSKFSYKDLTRISDGELGSFREGEEIVASYLCCLIMEYSSIYFSNNNCILNNFGYIDDYFVSNDEYMEDAFLKALFAINFYKKENDKK